MITNAESGTNINEIADGIYRINTPIALPGGQGFSFNQYLVVDEAPMLFHTGQRQLFPLVSEAIRAVLPIERLRYVGLSHFEADECGALNSFLAAAPQASRCAEQWPPWFRSMTSPIARRERSRTARSSCSAATQCAGTTHPTCPIPGNAG
jgi:flavorubredoxin